MRMVQKVAKLAFAAVMLAVLVVGAGCSGGLDGGGVAARFGEHVIYEDEVSAYTESYRAQNGLSDDASWASFLTGRGMTGKTWREEAIRQLADRLLIADKASELGVSADAQAVDERIAREKEAAGLSADDEQGWADYLAERGKTPEQVRADYEFSSVEQQVFRSELNFTTELQNEMCDDYIRTNLADQVVRHYAAITLDAGDEGRLQDYLDELRGLGGAALSKRFDEIAQEVADAGYSSLPSGDIGWDFLFGEYTLDPDIEVRKAKLEAGELYDGIVRGEDGGARLMLCLERVALEGVSYADIQSESLKSAISDLTLSSSWAAKCLEYLGELEEAAGIQVSAMPSGLAYDVVDSGGDGDARSGD